MIETSVRSFALATAAIWPSANGGVMPRPVSRALSAACHPAARASYGSIAIEGATTSFR